MSTAGRLAFIGAGWAVDAHGAVLVRGDEERSLGRSGKGWALAPSALPVRGKDWVEQAG